MKPKKSNSLIYIGASLALIIVAILFTTIINNLKNTSGTSVDIRTRASAPSLVRVTGRVSEVKESDGTVIVDELRFKDSTKNLGTWTVTPPPAFSLLSLFPGANITITVDPPTMMAQSRTLTATEIVVSR